MMAQMLACSSLCTLSCRLLRNRVSAQQARERKKQYINDLEDQMKDKVKEIQLLTAKLQVCSDENQALSADNKTLRRLIVTMRGGAPHPSQKTAPGASASRMGRPLRQDVSHGNVARSLPAHAPAEQYSSDSRENCLKVCIQKVLMLTQAHLSAVCMLTCKFLQVPQQD